LLQLRYDEQSQLEEFEAKIKGFENRSASVCLNTRAAEAQKHLICSPKYSN